MEQSAGFYRRHDSQASVPGTLVQGAFDPPSGRRVQLHHDFNRSLAHGRPVQGGPPVPAKVLKNRRLKERQRAAKKIRQEQIQAEEGKVKEERVSSVDTGEEHKENNMAKAERLPIRRRSPYPYSRHFRSPSPLERSARLPNWDRHPSPPRRRFRSRFPLEHILENHRGQEGEKHGDL